MRLCTSTRMVLGVVVLFSTAACNSDELGTADATAAPTGSTVIATTQPVATSAPALTTAPTTSTAPTLPVSTTAASTVPDMTVPDTTVPDTTEPPATDPVDTVAPPTTVPAPTAGTAIFYSGVGGEFPSTPIGVWTGTDWGFASWDATGRPVEVPSFDTVSATGIGLTAPITGLTVGELDYFCYGDEVAPRIALPDGAPSVDGGVIAVTADWNIQPRPALRSTMEAGVLQEAAESLVDTSETGETAGVVGDIVEADLDGDGATEILYTFARQTPDDSGFGTEDDFALVIAVYEDPDGVVRHHVLFELYEHPDVQPGNAEAGLTAAADLNGDGVMEVVLWWSYWESYAEDVHAFVDGRLELVTGGGCGA